MQCLSRGKIFCRERLRPFLCSSDFLKSLCCAITRGMWGGDRGGNVMGFFFLFLRTESDFCCLAGLFLWQSPLFPLPRQIRRVPFCVARLPFDKYLYFVRPFKLFSREIFFSYPRPAFCSSGLFLSAPGGEEQKLCHKTTF